MRCISTRQPIYDRFSVGCQNFLEEENAVNIFKSLLKSLGEWRICVVS